MNSNGIHLDHCTWKAAKFACENWHYSRTAPPSKSFKVGVWEQGRFIGAVIFGRGSNNRIGQPLGLVQTEICELNRVALREHAAPVSKIVATAIRIFKREFPGMKAIISYADPEQGHHGGIYQAMGWVYIGTSHAQREMILEGREVHKRTVSSRFGTVSPERIRAANPAINIRYGPIRFKHCYALPLCPSVAAKLAPIRKPYPKRAGSIDNDAPAIQRDEGGAIPTPALHS